MSEGRSLLLVQTTFPNEGKKLRGFIMGLIKGRIAVNVQRLNYMKSYSLLEGQYTQSEEKLLLIKIIDCNRERFEAYIKKNHPYEIPEIIYHKPMDIDSHYLGHILNN